jgi:hypothetical protein
MKKRTVRIISCLATVFVSLCLLAASCEPRCHDEFYLKNGMTTPITYTLVNTADSTPLKEVTVQPGEYELIYVYDDLGYSVFTQVDPTAFCYELQIPNCYHSVTFSDGTVWKWELEEAFCNDKDPFLVRCWTIFKKHNTKYKSDYKLDYYVDVTDYQRAVEQDK